MSSDDVQDFLLAKIITAESHEAYESIVSKEHNYGGSYVLQVCCLPLEQCHLGGIVVPKRLSFMW